MKYIAVLGLLGLTLLAADANAQDAELEAWVKDLSSRAAARRLRATRALRRAGKDALATLRRARRGARDPEEKRRLDALIREIEEIELVAGLTARKSHRRLVALERAVARHGWEFLESRLDPSLAPVLTDVLLFEWDTERREVAVELLARIGPPHSLRGLAWALKDRLGHMTSVTRHLAEQGDLSVVPDLRVAQTCGDPSAGDAIAAIRKRHPGPVPARRLVDPEPFRRDVADGEDARTRILAIRAVVTGLMEERLARDAVAGALRDRDASVRRWASRAFGYLSPEGVEERLIERVRRDPDRAVRIAACLSLGKGRRIAVVECLFETAAGADDELARAAASALGEVGGPAAAARLARLAANTDSAERRAALAIARQRILERANSSTR